MPAMFDFHKFYAYISIDEKAKSVKAKATQSLAFCGKFARDFKAFSVYISVRENPI